jgi:hypothetical protein
MASSGCVRPLENHGQGEGSSDHLPRASHTSQRRRGALIFLDRVDAVNASEQYAFKVKAVVLFGSYLSLQSRIGDVDLASELRPRHQSKQKQEEVERAARQRAKSLPTFLDELAWPEREVMRTLRGGDAVDHVVSYEPTVGAPTDDMPRSIPIQLASGPVTATPESGLPAVRVLDSRTPRSHWCPSYPRASR